LKQTEPNPLRQALAQSDAGPHPDADLLTAFAESALLQREREIVLAHLANCVNCRQILNFSGDAAEEQQAVQPLLAARRKRAVWRVAIPLLAAAAMIAVVSTVVLRSVMSRPPQVAVVSKKAEAPVNRPAPQMSSQQPPNKPEQKHQARKAAPAASESTPAAALPQAVAPLAQQASDADKRAEAAPLSPANGSIAMPEMSARVPAPAGAFANRSRALADAAGASITRPRWRLNQQGQPERAFGAGPWQPVPPNGGTRMQALSIFGGEVWAGGENSQVFRSQDNGTTWLVVTLPEKDGTAHSIAHIRFNSAQEITIEAADGTTWTTSDGGASWQ